MYVPPAFALTDLDALHDVIREARLGTLVTSTDQGLLATPVPLFLAAEEGPYGTLYGHVSRANPQGSSAALGDALALFSGPDAYVSPNWYAAKAEHHKVVPTWNYVAVHACGPVEFFDDPDRLLDIVTRLTDLHEKSSPVPWAVTDAPAEFIRAQLRGIIGLRLPIARLEGKRKMSQNRNAEDRAGVVAGLAASERPQDHVVAAMIPKD